MNEMTLSGLLRMGNSEYAREEANYMVIEVKGVGFKPEIIINPKQNFEMKLAYYAKSYNEDLTLKANPDIKIVRYDFVDDLCEYFW
jgi:hypothetical protein